MIIVQLSLNIIADVIKCIMHYYGIAVADCKFVKYYNFLILYYCEQLR